MSDPIDVAVGVRLGDFRRATGMSQQALGERLGVSFQQVQKYEKGINRVSASTMARAAQALSRSVAELMGEAPSAGLNRQTQEMVYVFDALPLERQRQAVLNLAKAMLE